MGIRVTGDRHECRIAVSCDSDIQSVRRKLEQLAGTEQCIVMPDEIVSTKTGYDMVFFNRHTLKECLCFDGFDMESYDLLMKALKNVFLTAKNHNESPYSFVFDINSVFCENNMKDISFAFTPETVTVKNNMCSDLLCLISLYSGYETGTPEEITMRKTMETVRCWEEESFSADNPSYDFPETNVTNRKKNYGTEKRILVLSGEKPFVSILKCSGENDVIGIGRDGTWAKIAMPYVFFSRKHASLSIKDGSLCMRDLNSKNGTFLNGGKMTPGREYKLSTVNKVKTGNGKSFILVCLF